MFPFWEIAVAPVLEAAGATRLVEIGALRGENTRLMIERLGPKTELHVIDPLPDFDPAVHEDEFGGQYVFHRALSLDVLADLPPMDAALIDGDHNWYTVFNEMRLLRQVAREQDAPLPVMLLHDVGWPYGRRDLYYDPDNIPAEFRKDWKRAGMEPGRVRLVPYGAGLNPTMANAKVEGGHRNGVMTAVDDFVAKHDRPLRVLVLPIYFGLAIVVEEERLDAQPELRAAIERLETSEFKDELLELAEEIRLDALMFQHRIFFDREKSIGRLARRYLAQVKDKLAGSDAERAGLDEFEATLDGLFERYVRGDVVVHGSVPESVAVVAAAYLDAHQHFDRRLVIAAGPGDPPADPDAFERFDLLTDRVDLHGDVASSEAVALVCTRSGDEVADVAGRLSEGAAVVTVAEDGTVAAVPAAPADEPSSDGAALGV